MAKVTLVLGEATGEEICIEGREETVRNQL
jgi:hypothetical protein